jgi:hypothetical protein
MKGVVEPARDLQMTVGRGQEKGLPYVLAPPPPRGRAFNFPSDTLGGKDIFPLGIGEKLKDRTERTFKHRRGISMPLERPLLTFAKPIYTNIRLLKNLLAGSIVLSDHSLSRGRLTLR